MQGPRFMSRESRKFLNLWNAFHRVFLGRILLDILGPICRPATPEATMPRRTMRSGHRQVITPERLKQVRMFWEAQARAERRRVALAKKPRCYKVA